VRTRNFKVLQVSKTDKHSSTKDQIANARRSRLCEGPRCREIAQRRKLYAATRRKEVLSDYETSPRTFCRKQRKSVKNRGPLSLLKTRNHFDSFIASCPPTTRPITGLPSSPSGLGSQSQSQSSTARLPKSTVSRKERERAECEQSSAGPCRALARSFQQSSAIKMETDSCKILDAIRFGNALCSVHRSIRCTKKRYFG